MKLKKALTLLATIGLAFTLNGFMPQEEVYKAKNLKVMAKNSSKQDVDDMMDSFKVALGVKCGYCHAPRTDDPKRLDFASDAKPEKEIAREMMRMTTKINKKYFHDSLKEGLMGKISCQTCHNGNSKPETAPLPEEPQKV